MLGTILLVVLILLLLGAIPTWPHSRRWGYAPSGALGTVLLIVLILVLWLFRFKVRVPGFSGPLPLSLAIISVGPPRGLAPTAGTTVQRR
jgi:hypothetical protein